MKKELSDKNYIILLTGDIRIWITEKEYKILESQLLQHKKFFILGNRIFNTRSIIYAGPRSEIEIADKIKKGEWKCQYGYWHSKEDKCGHGDLEKYNIPMDNSLK